MFAPALHEYLSEKIAAEGKLAKGRRAAREEQRTQLEEAKKLQEQR